MSQTSLDQHLSARVAAAQAEAEVARQQYLTAKMDAYRPYVAEALATIKTSVAANIANVDVISLWLIQNRRGVSEFTISEAIKALGSKLAQKPEPTEEEIRAEIEAEIMKLLVASPEEKERERQSYYSEH